MEHRPMASRIAGIVLLALLISSGLFASAAEAVYYNSNPVNQQESAEPISNPVGSNQQESDSAVNYRWVIKPYARNPSRVDLSSTPYFYNPLLTSYLKRQDKGLMLDIGALAVKNLVGGTGIGSSPVESKQNNVLQGILRHSG